MSKDSSTKSIRSLLSQLKGYARRFSKHVAFTLVILVLLIYAIVVLRIKSLAGAEPNSDQQQTVTTSIPHIDPQAIQQIQNLENNNADIHSLFEQARSNPFSE